MRFVTLFLLIFMIMPAHAADVQAFRGFKRLKHPIDVAILQVTTPQGNTASLGQFHGKWVLMNAWGQLVRALCCGIADFERVVGANIIAKFAGDCRIV